MLRLLNFMLSCCNCCSLGLSLCFQLLNSPAGLLQMSSGWDKSLSRLPRLMCTCLLWTPCLVFFTLSLVNCTTGWRDMYFKVRLCTSRMNRRRRSKVIKAKNSTTPTHTYFATLFNKLFQPLCPCSSWSFWAKRVSPALEAAKAPSSLASSALAFSCWCSSSCASCPSQYISIASGCGATSLRTFPIS